MSKVLDWSSIATVNFDDQRRKNTRSLTGKELFAKAHADLARAEQALAERRAAEPLLRKALLDCMVSKTPLTVLHPINNPTETLGGLSKSNDDDDGFYHGTGPNKHEQLASATYEETMETIPVGTQLIYKSWDRQLGQWLFKGSNGHEYAVYDKGVIIYKGNQIENPGLFGLLFNTDLVKVLGED